MSPPSLLTNTLPRPSPLPPTLQPLSFASGPIVDLDELLSSSSMVNGRLPLSTRSPAVTSIPANHLAGPTQHSAEQPTIHSLSDCGHYGSQPRLGRSHSLLRNFSLRSRNSSMPSHQNQLPPPPFASRLADVSGSASDSTSQSHSTTISDSSSDSNFSSIWKKWRVKSAGEPPHHVPTLRQERGRKRSLFVPFINVSRLVAFSSSPSSSHDSSSVFVPQSTFIQPALIPHLDPIQDEDDHKFNANSNPSSEIGHADFIRQIDGWVDAQNPDAFRTKSDLVLDLLTASDMIPPPLIPSTFLPPTNLSISLPLGSPPLPPLPTNSSISLPPSSPPLPPLPTNLSTSLPPSSPPLPPLPTDSSISLPPSSPPLPPLPTNLLTSPPLISPPLPPLPMNSSTSTPLGSPSSSYAPSSPSSNVDLALPPFSPISKLKPSISRRGRAQFVLDDELYDSLAVPARAPSGVARENSNTIAEPNNSVQTTATTAVSIQRPPLMRRERFETQDNGNTSTASTTEQTTRRWTLSSALTDEGISDEGLIKELERIRKLLERDCTPFDMGGHDTSSFIPSSSHPPPPSNTWLITQRALLTTRELILTERHYLSSLLLLLSPDSTLTPVPEMMISYVKELVSISERLLKGMLEEPSVRGVAEVFVEVGGVGGDGAESALVGWCGVVGRWFQDDLAVSGDTQDGVKRKRKRRGSGVGGGVEDRHSISEHEGSNFGLGISLSSFPTFCTTTENAHTSPLLRTVSTWRKSMPSISGLGESGVRRRERDKDEVDSTYGRRGSMPTIFNAAGASTSSSKPIRKPAVRDLAILPTQRVMRYVLLYRDLLANTPPSSSSYPIVERALEAACRIAEKCNQAQGNTAFVAAARHSGSCSSSGSSCSTLNNGGNSNNQRSGVKRATTIPESSLKLKAVWGSGPTKSVPNSPTKPHFSSSSSPVSTSPSRVLSVPPPTSLPRPSSSSSSSKPTPSSVPPPTKTRPVTHPSPPLPPPSSFHSKIPIAMTGRSASSTHSSTASNTSTFSSSSSSSSAGFPLSTPPSSTLSKSTSCSSLNDSSRMAKPSSGGYFMSLVKKNASGPGADSMPKRRYAGTIPTKVKA